MSINKRKLILLIVCFMLLNACAYIVVPDMDESSMLTSSRGWTALVTNVGQSESGDLHIDITIRNETTDWSAMQAEAGKPAVLKDGAGNTSNCDTVYVGTGGYRLAPGFWMRGYTAGTKAEPLTQLLYVECAGAQLSPGSTLTIQISYVTGEFNYYFPDTNKNDAELVLDLDQVVTDITYPIAEPIEGLILNSDVEILAMSDIVVTLANVERTDTGMQFTWHSFNPGEYALSTRIGVPPVIGEDGIIYGVYESPDRATAPTAPAGGTAEWTTSVPVPQNVKGLYILMNVEAKKLRLFTNFVMDITDK